MSNDKTEAVVIRQADFSESSRVVTFFTKDFGRMSALAKGAKRLKSAFEGGIDLLSSCRIVFIPRPSTSLNILTESKLVDRFSPASGRLDCLYGGYYVAELLSLLTEEGDPHPQLFSESLQTLESLREPDPGQALARFELRILHQTGHLPSFDACVACDTPTTTGGPWALWVSQGGVLCRSCQKPEFKTHPIQTGTLRVLSALADDDAALAKRLSISKAQCEEIRRLTTTSISHILGYRPKTLRYVEPGRTN